MEVDSKREHSPDPLLCPASRRRHDRHGSHGMRPQVPAASPNSRAHSSEDEEPNARSELHNPEQLEGDNTLTCTRREMLGQ